MKTSKLKPCPFCGSPAEVRLHSHTDISDENTVGQWTVICTEESAECNARILYCSTKEYAIKSWNRRVDFTSTEGGYIDKSQPSNSDPMPIQLMVNDYEDRQAIITALVNSGYKVSCRVDKVLLDAIYTLEIEEVL